MIGGLLSQVSDALVAAGLPRVYAGPWDEARPSCVVVELPSLDLSRGLGCGQVAAEFKVLVIAERTTDKHAVDELDSMLAATVAALHTLPGELSSAEPVNAQMGGQTFPAYQINGQIFI